MNESMVTTRSYVKTYLKVMPERAKKLKALFDAKRSIDKVVLKSERIDDVRVLKALIGESRSGPKMTVRYGIWKFLKSFAFFEKNKKNLIKWLDELEKAKLDASVIYNIQKGIEREGSIIGPLMLPFPKLGGGHSLTPDYWTIAQKECGDFMDTIGAAFLDEIDTFREVVDSLEEVYKEEVKALQNNDVQAYLSQVKIEQALIGRLGSAREAANLSKQVLARAEYLFRKYPLHPFVISYSMLVTMCLMAFTAVVSGIVGYIFEIPVSLDKICAVGDLMLKVGVKSYAGTTAFASFFVMMGNWLEETEEL